MLPRNTTVDIVATCWAGLLDVGTLEDLARVDVHVDAGDVGQVDVEAGSHRHGDRRSSPLRTLGSNQPPYGRRLRVQNANVEGKPVFVERSERHRQLAGRSRHSCRDVSGQRHVDGLPFVHLTYMITVIISADRVKVVVDFSFLFYYTNILYALLYYLAIQPFKAASVFCYVLFKQVCWFSLSGR